MLLDPFGIRTFSLITKYWTVSDKNNLALHLTGYLLLNRLIWVGVGLAIFIFAGVRFSFSERSKKVKKSKEVESASPAVVVAANPAFEFGWSAKLAQFVGATRTELSGLVKSVSFIVIATATLLNCIPSLALNASEGYGNGTYPVTYWILELIQGSMYAFLIGIGYIIGPEYASVNVAGGILAWWVLIPLLLFFDPDFATRLGGIDKVSGATASFTIWYNVVRPLAVGMMLVAAVRTLFSMRAMLVESLRGAWNASRHSGAPVKLDPTEQDIPPQWVIGISVVLTIALAGIYHSFTKEWPSAIAAAIVMAFAGFVLSAVGGYLGGLVGVSNQPTSGLTLSALVLAALVMISMGVHGPEGVAAVLGVAGVVCVAVSTSGSLLQDLKAGHLLGGTPWKMQVVEIIAVVVLSFFLLGPIIALHEANLATGGIGGRDLPAPQAGLMAQLAVGIVNGEMAWGLLGAGAALGVALILCGAKAPMLIAVGMYLPFDTSAAIFAGGAIQWLAQKFLKGATVESKAKAEETGTLLASGLIAGEAIAGIILAVTFLAGLPYIAKPGLNATIEGWLSLVAFLGLAALLIGFPARDAKRQ